MKSSTLMDDKATNHHRYNHNHLLLRRDGDDGSKYEASLSGVLLDGFFPFDHDSAAIGGIVDDDDHDNISIQTSSSNSISSSSASTGAETIRQLMNPKSSDRIRRNLLADVTAVAERFISLRLTNKSSFRRAVTSNLREKGYNAGICKSRWGSGAGGITPGSHEYIDVLVEVKSSSSSSSSSTKERRYIVDPDFASEFEIARATEEYVGMMEELPRVFVGKEGILKRCLKVMGKAARRSLRSREMHIPPWRKTKYLEAKWLAPYKRTTFSSPPTTTTTTGTSMCHHTMDPASSPTISSYCRAVGFQTSAEQLVMPATMENRSSHLYFFLRRFE